MFHVDNNNNDICPEKYRIFHQPWNIGSNHANDIIYRDTIDIGVFSKNSNNSLSQARRDAFYSEYGISVLDNHSSKDSRNVFQRDHIMPIVRPNTIICDQGKEFLDEFKKICKEYNMNRQGSALARGQSQALKERLHREFWITRCCELGERNIEVDE